MGRKDEEGGVGGGEGRSEVEGDMNRKHDMG